MSKSVSFGRKVNLFFKRSFDIIFSLMMIAALALPCAVVALAVALDMHAGPFFTQDRVGRDGKLFRMIKFRTMTPDAPKDVPTYELQDAHKYITRLGNILRKTSIDELPQLWNVLKGDMSIVGPRPGLPREVALYDEYDKQRLIITPGLTCYWQVQKNRNSLSFDKWLEWDIRYIQERSFRTDWKIIFKTFGVVFGMRGV